MSRVQSIHINFQLTEKQKDNEFWYEQLYFFLKENGWVLDLTEPIEFLEPGEMPLHHGVDTDVRVGSEAELIEKIREKERLNETMRLGRFNNGENSFDYELKKIDGWTMNFWFLVNDELVGEEVCVIFEYLSRKIVKPFCDTFRVDKIDLMHG